MRISEAQTQPLRSDLATTTAGMYRATSSECGMRGRVGRGEGKMYSKESRFMKWRKEGKEEQKKGGKGVNWIEVCWCSALRHFFSCM